MALFGKKKDTAKESAAVVKETPKKVAMPTLATNHNLASVIKSTRITEKSVGMSEQNVYTFVVRKDANKFMIRDAIKALYNVTPVKVNIVNKVAAKRLKGSRGKMVHDKGMKKAYVYLKKGETITIV
jgi:large subunit ribosomal protein L23